MKKTAWFIGAIKPIHAGVYETKSPFVPSHIGYQHWDGEKWGFYMPSPDGAWSFRKTRSEYQEQPWRGLAQKPK